ncbi:hypothetical protein [Streptomyces sp. NRRL F-5755]|uniref:hypothetical protein n=1 Tax=Streptomyces sp. NRRL F-5755 TaxID=1519475 RepID=UPI000AB6C21C|nr:hypothetical protein [Streptomyces sp. NRRL F-5755]
MRKKLEAEGYQISGYREDKTKKPWALMDADGGKDDLSVSVENARHGSWVTFLNACVA